MFKDSAAVGLSKFIEDPNLKGGSVKILDEDVPVEKLIIFTSSKKHLDDGVEEGRPSESSAAS